MLLLFLSLTILSRVKINICNYHLYSSTQTTRQALLLFLYFYFSLQEWISETLWHITVFSFSFPSLRGTSWQQPFHWDHPDEASGNSGWVVCRARCVSQALCQVFAAFFSYFSRTWLSGANRFSVNSPLKAALLVQKKSYFMIMGCVIFWHFL